MKVPFRLRRLQRVDFTGDYLTGINQILNVLNLFDKKSHQSPTQKSVSKTSKNNEPASKKPSKPPANVVSDFLEDFKVNAETRRPLRNKQSIGKQKDYFILDPYILVISNSAPLSSFNEIPVFDKIAQTNRPLIIIAKGFEGEAMKYITPHEYKDVITLVLRAPGFGDRQKEIFTDMAIYSGAMVISEEMGYLLNKITMGQLGEAESVRVNYLDKSISVDVLDIPHDTVTINKGKADRNTIEERINELARRKENNTSDYDKEKLQECINRFQVVKDSYTFEYFDLSI